MKVLSKRLIRSESALYQPWVVRNIFVVFPSPILYTYIVFLTTLKKRKPFTPKIHYNSSKSTFRTLVLQRIFYLFYLLAGCYPWVLSGIEDIHEDSSSVSCSSHVSTLHLSAAIAGYKVNILYGQSSAKLPVILSSFHHIIMSSYHHVNHVIMLSGHHVIIF